MWAPLKSRLIETVDADYRVYEGDSFNTARFVAYLARSGIPWPFRPSGVLKLTSLASARP